MEILSSWRRSARATASIDYADLFSLLIADTAREVESLPVLLDGKQTDPLLGCTATHVFEATVSRGEDGIIGLIILDDPALNAIAVVVGIEGGSRAERDRVIRLGDVILDVDGKSVQKGGTSLYEILQNSAERTFLFKVLRAIELRASTSPRQHHCSPDPDTQYSDLPEYRLPYAEYTVPLSVEDAPEYRLPYAERSVPSTVEDLPEYRLPYAECAVPSTVRSTRVQDSEQQSNVMKLNLAMLDWDGARLATSCGMPEQDAAQGERASAVLTMPRLKAGAPLFKSDTPRHVLFKHAAALLERHQKLAHLSHVNILCANGACLGSCTAAAAAMQN